MCDQTGSEQMKRGTWVSFPIRRPFKLPLPDCAKVASRRAINTTVAITYNVNTCSPDLVQKAKKMFLTDLLNSMGSEKVFKVICNKDRGCVPENVNVTCFTDQPRRHKRSIDPPATKSVLKISFTLALYPDEGENKEQDNVFESISKRKTIPNSILKQIESTTTKMVKNVYKMKDLRPSNVNYDVVAICLRGQMQINGSCVSCPAGTFKDDFTDTCTDCKTASYQDEENSLMCKPCPVGYTTYQIRSTSLQDCKGPCAAGTYSRNTFEPCSPCPLHTYQDFPASRDCKKCPSGLETWRVGSNSSDDCVSPCPPGSYSDTGLEPCEPCDSGSYQELAHQNSCNVCTNGTSTEKEGSVSRMECKELNICNQNATCLHGATCMPLPSNTAYICLCPYGFVGRHCEKSMDFCEEKPCLNDGVCVNQDGGYSCVCKDGYSGVKCETIVDDCLPGFCLNGGKCTSLLNQYNCACPAGFTGSRCEINIDDCKGNPCQNGGTCFDKVDDYRCCCAAGYTGRHCDIPQDPCLTTTCHNGGTCHSNGTSALCACQRDTSGPFCEVVEDTCSKLQCLNGGSCLKKDGVAVCGCPVLFGGAYCEKALEPDYTLIFTTPTTSNYIELQNPRILLETTISFFMRTTYKTKDARPTPVSYSYVDQRGLNLVDNALTLYDTNMFILFIHGEMLYTEYVANSDTRWHHYAITWKSSNGDWSFSVDGLPIKSGTGVGADRVLWPGVFVLGQEQDSLGGTFSSSEAFSGEIAEFNVWDYALTQDELRAISSSCGHTGNVIPWIRAQEHMYGSVSLQKKSEICQTKGACTTDDCFCIYNKEKDDTCKHRVASCNPNPCKNGHPCDVVGTATYCNCSNKYDGKFCEYDVDECLWDNGGCSHECRNSFGGFECRCPEGWILSEDNRTCKETTFCTTKDGWIVPDGEVYDGDKGEMCVCDKGVIECLAKTCHVNSSADCKPSEMFLQFPASGCPTCMEYSKCTIDLTTQATGRTLMEDCTHGQYRLTLENTSALSFHHDCSKLQIKSDPNQLPYEDSNFKTVPSKDLIEIYSKSQLYVRWMLDSAKMEIFAPRSDVTTACGVCSKNYSVEDESLEGLKVSTFV